MGTHLGIVVAAEPRITCAIFGLLGLREGAFAEAARSITIPLQFIFQWDDELMTREAGVALFGRPFASKEKTMHMTPAATWASRSSRRQIGRRSMCATWAARRTRRRFSFHRILGLKITVQELRRSLIAASCDPSEKMEG